MTDLCTLLIQIFPLLTFYYNSLFEVYLRPHLLMHAWPSFRVETILFWVYFHMIILYKQIVTLNWWVSGSAPAVIQGWLPTLTPPVLLVNLNNWNRTSPLSIFAQTWIMQDEAWIWLNPPTTPWNLSTVTLIIEQIPTTVPTSYLLHSIAKERRA